MGERLGNGAIWTSGCRIQGVSKVVRPCERRRNSHLWRSSNGEWHTNTCEFCSWMFQGCHNERFQRVCGRRSHRTSHVCNVSQWAAFICCETKSRQITENPVPRRRPCQQRKLVDVIGIHRWSGGLMLKTAYKRRHMKSSSIATHLYVNKTGITQTPHCQGSFCPPLKISFQSRFSIFDNISHVMILLSSQWILLLNASRMSQQNISAGMWQKESPNKPRLQCFPMSSFYLLWDQK